MKTMRTMAADTFLPAIGAVLFLQVFGAIAGVLAWFVVERNSTKAGPHNTTSHNTTSHNTTSQNITSHSADSLSADSHSTHSHRNAAQSSSSTAQAIDLRDQTEVGSSTNDLGSQLEEANYR